VRQVITKIAKRAPYDARNAWGHAVGIFKLAVHDELIEISPCASLDKRMLFANVSLSHRDRVLNFDEVLAFWRGAGRLGYPYGPFYRLLLLTAVRIGELIGARWSELHPEIRQAIREARARGEGVDWSALPAHVKVWTVPAERFKSEVDHIVPLQDDALRIIETLPVWGRGDLLFTTTEGKKPVNGFSKAKGRLDREMKLTLRAVARRRGDDWREAKVAAWVNHDLRRVVRTNLSAMRVDDHVAEMCLGHGRKGLQRVYDQHRYLEEIRAAMEAWAERLRRLTGQEPQPKPTPAGDNVVPIRKVAG
jgi:integrase